MARRAVLAEAARALLSSSRRCVRCAPRRTIPRVSRETSARAIARRRPDSPTGALSDPFASLFATAQKPARARHAGACLVDRRDVLLALDHAERA